MKRLLLMCCLLVPVLSTAQQTADVAPAEISPADFVEVDPALVRGTLSRLFAQWNTPGLRDWIADGFGERRRLLDVLTFEVPAQARLRLLSIGPVRVIEQKRTADALISVVAVRVLAQLEYETAEAGFQRREGIAEYVLRLTQRVPE